MATHRDTLVDAAIKVLSEGGSRALTHRAVDQSAGVPTGTCSNHFRTRAALVAAVADELERQDMQLAEVLDVVSVRSADDVADLADAFITAQLANPGPQRARLALATEPSVDLSAHHDRLRTLMVGVMSSAGLANPSSAARMAVDHLDGVLLNGLMLSTRKVNPGEVAEAMRRLLGPSSA